MTFGNLVALRQSSLKRFSPIRAMLMAVAVAERIPDALPAVSYYLVAYLCMNLAAFTVVAQVERLLGEDDFAMIRGLGRRAP